MVKTLNIFILSFYFLGSLCFPLSDFSLLPGLPEMYRHCKATEDKDMGPLDFVTDHLINIDGLFDRHNNGDEQKPHAPVPNNHTSQIVVFQLPPTFCFKTIQDFIEKKTFILPNEHPGLQKYFSDVFRPPIIS